MTSAKKGTISQFDAHIEKSERDSRMSKKQNLTKIDLSVVPSKIVSAHKSIVQSINLPPVE